MEDWTIAEECTLPSQGKVYESPVNANLKLRSMTTEEEMKRLGHSPNVYKMFSDIIDDCLVGEKPGISVYDMCLGDYQYLLYKLRTVTYGPEYTIQTICPHCGTLNTVTINLESLNVRKYSEEINKAKELQLPVSKKLIKLKLQTPRMLDEVDKQTKELNKKSSDNIESAVLFNLMSLIDTIDGVKYEDTKKEIFIRKLPMRDVSKILNAAKNLIKKLGIDTNVTCSCSACKQEYETSLPITGEFFGPSED